METGNATLRSTENLATTAEAFMINPGDPTMGVSVAKKKKNK